MIKSLDQSQNLKLFSLSEVVKLDAVVRQRLSQFTIGIAGLGGLGSNVAVSLARIGIGKLVLVDFDRVEVSNLNRQYYFRRHIGMYKTDALREVLEAIDENVELKITNERLTEDNILKLFDEADILVEALDDAKVKSMFINEILLHTDKKIVAGSGLGGYDSNNRIKTRKVMNRLYICGDEDGSSELFLAPRVNIVAHQQANTVLRLCMGLEEV